MALFLYIQCTVFVVYNAIEQMICTVKFVENDWLKAVGLCMYKRAQFLVA